jgi:hypothetical protein
MTRIPLYFVIGGLLLAGSLYLGFREPRVFVTVTNMNGRTLVQWRKCGLGEPGPVWNAEVSEEPTSRGDPVCALIAKNSGVTPLRGTWQYGSREAGYTLTGDCPTLKKQVIYRAAVGGSIGGDALFRIRDDNDIEILERSCTWWNR